nr:uncharacterized protein LOC113808116 [Penaeus vannamei]
MDKWFWPPFCLSLLILTLFGTVVSFATWHWAKQSVAVQNEVLRKLLEREANTKCRKILRAALINRTEEVVQVAQREMQRVLDEECPARQRREIIKPFLVSRELLSTLPAVEGGGDDGEDDDDDV